MWLRLLGALATTLVVLVLMDTLGPAGRDADELRGVAHERPRELFWMLIFVAVMGMSLLAAARRARDQLLGSLSRSSPPRES